MLKKIKIKGREIQYILKKRNIKYPRLEYRSGKLTAVVPVGFSSVDDFIKQNQNWVIKKGNEIKEAVKRGKKKKLFKRREDKFRVLIKGLLISYCFKTGLKYNEVFFKDMSTKWASCSSRGNITINNRISYLPLQHIRYIILHEILHLKIRKHNKDFFDKMKKEFGNIDKYEKDLLDYWFAINGRKNET